MQRHLICHIYPLRSTGTWRRTVAHLKARWSLFTGMRFVSVATGPETDSLQDVRDAFSDVSRLPYVFDVANDPQLGEGASFPKLLDMVQAMKGQTFYCHSKGCTYPDGHIAQAWADVGFHLCLDYPAGLSVLSAPSMFDNDAFPKRIAGPFCRIENRMGVPWHYSGTLFWFKNDRALRFPKTNDRNCVERWPSENFTLDQLGSLGLENCRNLYDEINWRSYITRRFQTDFLWNEEHVKGWRREASTDWASLPPTRFQPLQAVYDEFKVPA